MSAFVQHIGDTSNGNSSETSTVLTVSKTVSLGNSIFVGFADWASAGSPTCTDNLGNTYTLDASASGGGGRYNYILRAIVTNAGTLTTITVSHTASSYCTMQADEFSGVGTFDSASVPADVFIAAATTWDTNATIPADGMGYGMMQTDAAQTPTAGAASGSPSTASVLGTYRADGTNISGSSWYALAGGSTVTGFNGNITLAGSTTGLTVGANYNPAAGGGTPSLTARLIAAAV